MSGRVGSHDRERVVRRDGEWEGELMRGREWLGGRVSGRVGAHERWLGGRVSG